MIHLMLVSITLLLVVILLNARRSNRRTRREFINHSEASQLRRGASHLYRIALTAKVHALHDTLVIVLLQEVARMLKLAVKMEPENLSTHAALTECNETLVSFDQEMHEHKIDRRVVYPESELLLLEAKMHLTEIYRQLRGMKQRQLLSPELCGAIVITLQYAERALELRLILRKVSLALRIENTSGPDSRSFDEYPHLTSPNSTLLGSYTAGMAVSSGIATVRAR